MSGKFRLDRTAFKVITAEDADDHITYWKGKTYAEKMAAACTGSTRLMGQFRKPNRTGRFFQ